MEDKGNEGNESAYIRALNPSLNRRSDRADRYTLPATYDSILKAAVKAPPPPLPHQPTKSKFFTGDRRQGRQRRIISSEPRETMEITTTTPNPTNDNQATQNLNHHTTREKSLRSLDEDVHLLNKYQVGKVFLLFSTSSDVPPRL